MDENVEKVLLLTTELMGKEKIIEIMKKIIDKKNEELLINYEKKKMLMLML